MRYRQVQNLTTWFAVGIGVGTALGFLYAPYKGKKTRRFLARGTRKAGDQLATAGFVVQRAIKRAAGA